MASISLYHFSPLTFVEECESNTALDPHLASTHLQVATVRVPELVAEDPDIRRYALIR